MCHVYETDCRPDDRSFEVLLDRLRAALPHMRTERARTALDQVLCTLRAEPRAGSAGNAPLAAPRAMDAYRRAVRDMTANDRDLATDEIVLAMLFAIMGDEAKAHAHLDALSASESTARGRVRTGSAPGGTAPLASNVQHS